MTAELDPKAKRERPNLKTGAAQEKVLRTRETLPKKELPAQAGRALEAKKA